MVVDRREEDDDSIPEGWTELLGHALALARLWSELPAGFQTLAIVGTVGAVCSALTYICCTRRRAMTGINKPSNTLNTQMPLIIEIQGIRAETKSINIQSIKIDGGLT